MWNYIALGIGALATLGGLAIYAFWHCGKSFGGPVAAEETDNAR